MANSTTISKTTTSGGKTFTETTTKTTDAVIVQEQAIPVAWPAVLTTRTDTISGSITADDAGHLISTADVVDLYWTEGGVTGECRGAVVGTVAGQVIPFTAVAGGDVLPTQANAIIVAPRVSAVATFTGANATFIVMMSSKRGTFTFAGADDAEDWAKVIQAAKQDQWYDDTDEANPVTGDTVTQCFMSHADTAAVATMKFAVGY